MGIILAVLVGLVFIGGIQRIAVVAGKLEPFMAILNLIALIMLSPVIVKLTKQYFATR